MGLAALECVSRRYCLATRPTAGSSRQLIDLVSVKTISRSLSSGVSSAAASAAAATATATATATGCQQPAPRRPVQVGGPLRMLHHCRGTSSHSAGSSKGILFGRHVREAMANGLPIVALESTVITHGLPQPQNLHLALALEQEIRRQSSDCTPATVAIIRGQIVVGLSSDEIHFLANLDRSQPIKASRRDIPICLARGLSAGTTVAATMAIAASSYAGPSSGLSHLAGLPPGGGGGGAIKVFATGGTGGVHRGGELSMDVSADLYEFARSPLGVVSSGFKSFLDTRRSLEFLETLGCTVVSLADDDDNHGAAHAHAHENANEPEDPPGREQQQQQQQQQRRPGANFPAFYSRDSRVRSPFSVSSIKEAAQILFQCLESPVGDRRAMLLANPICRGAELNLDDLLATVSAQIDERTDLEGKDKTPLILEQINRRTAGKSLGANIELLKGNARVGAQLAMEYAQIINGSPTYGSRGNSKRATSKISSPSLEGANLSGRGPGDEPAAAGERQGAHHNHADDKPEKRPVVVGCTMIDMHVSTKMDHQFRTNSAHSGATFVGDPHLTVGGVARNLATALQYLGHEPRFLTALARDNLAKLALDQFRAAGFSFEHDCDDRQQQLQVSWLSAQPEEMEHKQQQHGSSCFALVLMDSIKGQCEYVIANLEATKAISPQTIEREINQHDAISGAPLLVMDANLRPDTMESLVLACHRQRVPMFLEPTDVVALPSLVGCILELRKQNPQSLESIVCLSPNLLELHRMKDLFEHQQQDRCDADQSLSTDLEFMAPEAVERLARDFMANCMPELTCLLVTIDKRGLVVAIRSDQTNGDGDCELDKIHLMDRFRGLNNRTNNGGKSIILTRHFEPLELVDKPVSASGAGDSFAAGFISGLLDNLNLVRCIEKGFKASLLALNARDTIPASLESLNARANRK